MKSKTTSRRPRIVITDRLVATALSQAADDAVDAHRLANAPLVVWGDDRPVQISSDAIRSLQPKRPATTRRKRRS